jgi:putative FmdB family regulatory protein
MPLYEYQCARGHITESLQLLTEKAAHVKCPQCPRRAYPIVSAVAGIVKNPAVPRGRPRK